MSPAYTVGRGRAPRGGPVPAGTAWASRFDRVIRSVDQTIPIRGDASRWMPVEADRSAASAGARYRIVPLQMIRATTHPLLTVLMVLLALDAAAHPGRTAAYGCHFCRTNCARPMECRGQQAPLPRRHDVAQHVDDSDADSAAARRVPGIHRNMAGNTSRPGVPMHALLPRRLRLPGER